MAELSRRPQPLHGDWVPALYIEDEGTGRKLTKYWRTSEMGRFERVATSTHSDYPGIKIYELFEANHNSLGEPPSLEQAMSRGLHAERFLLSIVRRSLVVVTSRIGYSQSGEFAVRFPEDAQDLTFDMYDCQEDITNPELTAHHIGRLALLDGDPSVEVSQRMADRAFRTMVQ